LKYTVKSTNVFDEMGSYWAEIADQSATERQIQFIKNAVKKEGWILDLACGTGRHTIPLTNQGYRVLGLDISVKLLKIANHRLPQAQLVKADMQYLPFNDGVFAAALSMVCDKTSGQFLVFEHTARLYMFSRLQELLLEAGFLVNRVYGDYERQDFSADSNRLIILANAK
jgi:SAM-dependent methyltransferase